MYLDNIMQGKKNIISIIMFSLYTALFVFFVFTMIFGGQKIAGAFYFVIFAVSLAFAFLERKYGASYKSLYRFSIYIADAVNICAMVSFLCYRICVPFVSASLGVYFVIFIVDLFSHNRNKLQSKLNILALVFNCLFMALFITYFFDAKIGFVPALIGLVVSVLVLAIKIVLAFKHELEEKEQVNDELSEKIKSSNDDRVE